MLVTKNKELLEVLTEQQREYLRQRRPLFASDIIRLMTGGIPFEESVRITNREHDIRDRRRCPVMEGEDFLKSLPHRKEIRDPEAYDIDAKLYNNIEKALFGLKRYINWNIIKETVGKGPHGLYYRRLSLVLDSLPPLGWRGCRCNQGPPGNPQFNCPICRGGGYIIGKP